MYQDFDTDFRMRCISVVFEVQMELFLFKERRRGGGGGDNGWRGSRSCSVRRGVEC